MDQDTEWIVPIIFGMLILIAVATVAGIGISEFLKARRNRTYKSIEQHRANHAARRGPNVR